MRRVDERLVTLLRAYQEDLLRSPSAQLQRQGCLFDVREFAIAASQTLLEGSLPDTAMLVRICRKMEIAKRVFAVYEQQRFVAPEESPAIEPKAISLLLVVMIGCALLSRDLRYINTVLKVDSVGLDMPEGYEVDREILELADRVLVDFFHA